MKISNIIILPFFYLISLSLFAQRDIGKMKNMNEDAVYTKAFDLQDEKYPDLLHKKVYVYEHNTDRLLDVVSYWKVKGEKWNLEKKHSYEYNADGKLTMIAYNRWDVQQNVWSGNGEYMVFMYDENQVLYTIKKLKGKDNIITLF